MTELDVLLALGGGAFTAVLAVAGWLANKLYRAWRHEMTDVKASLAAQGRDVRELATDMRDHRTLVTSFVTTWSRELAARPSRAEVMTLIDLHRKTA